jgi:hypothetical protein
MWYHPCVKFLRMIRERLALLTTISAIRRYVLIER